MANRKWKAKMSLRDGRSFKEAAKGAKYRVSDNLSSAHGEGKMLEVGEPSVIGRGRHSPSPLSTARGEQQVAYKSPKKRFREEFEEREANSEADLEVIGVFNPTTNTITP